MIADYLSKGFLVFRGIVPRNLLSDLRKQADRARDLAHKLNGPQAQRIQPLDHYADEIDLGPFRDYLELDELRQAVEQLLGPGYIHGQLNSMGLLVEPVNHPWHCGWHRDGVVDVPPQARDDKINAILDEVWHDLRFFNQVNCAIYADSCTWLVPGSHLRSFDLQNECQSTDNSHLQQLPDGMDHAEAERFYVDHCEAMPGAQQIHLRPGDFMIYRNLGWHTGLYVPYQLRATIHTLVSHQTTNDWRNRWTQAKSAAVSRLEKHQATGP